MNTQQTCYKCEEDATIELSYGQKYFCEEHFLEMMEKRFRREIRKFYDIDFDHTYYAWDNGTAEYEIMRYFLDNIFDDYFDLERSDELIESQYCFEPTNMEKEIDKMLQAFFNNEEFKFTPTIKPMRVLKVEEIEWLKKVLEIDREIERVDNEFVEKMEEKYQSTKFSLIKSMKYFEEENL